MPGRRRRGTGACHRGPGRHGGARPGSGLGSQARGQKGPDESLISVTRPHGPISEKSCCRVSSRKIQPTRVL
jgi:hypothetical protein